MRTHSLYVVTALAGILLGGLLLAGPSTVLGENGQPRAAAFARGAKAWADNCTRCHNMRDPKEFRDDQWRPIVAHMRVRAGLTGPEARDILLFLQSSN